MGIERSVVVGAVVVRDGRVLAARRRDAEPREGGWEFPGGKVEAGETPRAALAREVVEELAVTVEVGAEVVGDAPWTIADRHVLRLFLASVTHGEPTPGSDHDELRWLAPAELGSVTWLPADELALPAVVAALQSGPA